MADLRKLPNLSALRAFEAAARLESFSRAAAELFLTHGAVSHQIRGLEEELGVALFARHGKRVRITEAGRRYAQQVRTALTDLALATQSIAAGNRDRRLVVSTMPSFAARWLAPRIGSFIETCPQYDFELRSSSELTDFDREDVDVALRLGAGRYPGLFVEKLLDETFFLAASPTLNGGLPRTPADVPSFPLIRSDSESWQPWFDAAGLPNQRELRRGPLFHDSSMALQAAIDGQGIALVRRSLALADVAAGKLVKLFDVEAPAPWAYYFVCRPTLADAPRISAFRAWLVEQVAAFRRTYGF